MASKSNDKHPYERHTEETHRGGGSNETMEAETGVTVATSQGMSIATSSWKGSPKSLQREYGLDRFQSTGLQDYISVLPSVR